MGGGSLKHLVRFERRRNQKDGHGSVEGEWERALLLPVPAAISQSGGGDEQVVAGRVQQVSSFVVTVRASRETRTITTRHRIIDERSGVIFNITAVRNPDIARGISTWIEFACTSKGDTGG